MSQTFLRNKSLMVVFVFSAAILIGGSVLGDEGKYGVVAPTSANTLNAGELFTIAWNEPQNTPGILIAEQTTITISLRQDGVQVMVIGTVSDFGYREWSVPAGLSGTYTIFISRVNSGQIETAESDQFVIRDSSITFVAPTISEQTWTAGTSVGVAWSGDPGSLIGVDVVLVALDGSAQAETIATAIDPSSAAIQILLPTTLRVRSYQMQLRETTNPLSSPIATLSHTIKVVRIPGPYPDGALLREENAEEVWLIKVLPSGKEFRRHVLTWDMALWYSHIGSFWSAVTIVPDGTLDQYTPSAWIRLVMTDDPGTWKVFEVNADATKHWLTCASADFCGPIWRARGGDADGIYTVNTTEMNFYSTGLNVFFEQSNQSDLTDEALESNEFE